MRNKPTIAELSSRIEEKRMISCQKCETELDLRWHFCPNCGVRIAIADALLAEKVINGSAAFKFGTYGKGVREHVFEVVVRWTDDGEPNFRRRSRS